ncbi:MAG: hypothetical protein ACXW53_04610 [Candidatus Binatia bacterium]
MMTIEQRIRADFPSPVLGVDVLKFLSYRRTYSYDEQLLEGYRFIEGDYYVSDFTNVYIYRQFSFYLFPIIESFPLLQDYRIVWAEADWFEKNEFAILKRQEALEEARRLRLATPPKRNVRGGGGERGL